jgi:hypothetical protein
MHETLVCTARCASHLERRVTVVEHAIDAAEGASRANRCRRAIRAAARGARTLDRRLVKMAATRRFAAGAPVARLTAEAARLHARADVLAASFCAAH